MKKMTLFVIVGILTTLLFGCGKKDEMIYDIYFYRIQNGYAEIFALTEEGQQLSFIEFPTEINGYPVKIGSYYGFGIDQNAARIKSDKLEVVIIRRGISILTHALEQCNNLKYVVFLDDEIISMEGGFIGNGRMIVIETLYDWYQSHRGGNFQAAKVAFYIDDSLYHLSYDDDDYISEPQQPSKEGFEFVGWSETSIEEDLFDFSKSSSNINSIILYPVWGEK